MERSAGDAWLRDVRSADPLIEAITPGRMPARYARGSLGRYHALRDALGRLGVEENSA